MTFTNKFSEGSERMSLRLPAPLKNHIWKAAKLKNLSATDVVIEILSSHFAGEAPAPKWKPGSTKTPKPKKDKRRDQKVQDIFA